MKRPKMLRPVVVSCSRRVELRTAAGWIDFETFRITERPGSPREMRLRRANRNRWKWIARWRDAKAG